MYLSYEIERAVWANAPAIKEATSLGERASLLNSALAQYGIVVMADKRSKTDRVRIFGSYYIYSDQAQIVLSNRNLIVAPLLGKQLAMFLFEVNCTAQHELIHKYQWVHRDPDLHGPRAFRGHSKQEYLAGFDEIETQAHDAAMEIRFFYPQMQPRDVLRGYFNKSNINLPSVNNYMKAFDGDTRHPAVKRFLRKTYSWLEHVSVLRPVTYRL